MMNGNVVDPDSWMRLLRIRQGLNHHGWLVNYVMRDDDGSPLVVEWSRLYDAIIVIVALPLMIFVKQGVAIMVAGLILTPILSGATAVVVAFIARLFCRHNVLWLSGIFVGTAIAFIKQNGLGTVQYHMFIVFSLAMAIACGFELLLGQKDRNSHVVAVIGGVLGAFSIWAMVESWAFVFAIYACLVCYDVFHKKSNISLLWSAALFASVTLFTYIDPPYDGFLSVSYDHISVIFVCLSALLFVARALCQLLPLERVYLKLVVAIFAPIAIWLLIFFKVVLGPWEFMGDSGAKLFFAYTAQTAPIHEVWKMLSYGFPGLIAFSLSAYMAYRNRRNLMILSIMSIIAFSSLFAVGLAMRFQILTPFAALFGSIAALYLIDKSIDVQGVLVGFLSRFFAIFLVICGSFIIYTVGVVSEPHTKSVVESCDITPQVVREFNQKFGDNLVLTPIVSVPELLYKTHITTVGSLYQHGIPYFVQAYNDWYLTNGDFTNIKYVAFCKDASFVRARSGSLGKDLVDNNVPKYLKRIGEVGSWQLFKVIESK